MSAALNGAAAHDDFEAAVATNGIAEAVETALRPTPEQRIEKAIRAINTDVSDGLDILNRAPRRGDLLDIIADQRAALAGDLEIMRKLREYLAGLTDRLDQRIADTEAVESHTKEFENRLREQDAPAEN